MKKNIFTLILAGILCFFTVIPVFAASETTSRLVDGASLLSGSEELDLEAKLDDVSIKHNFDVVIVTVNSIGGRDIRSYAENYYQENGYGVGSENDGIIFLVAMRSREYNITSFGYGKTAFTDDGLEQLADRVIGYLSDGEYAKSFNKFAELCDRYLEQAEKGEPYDKDNAYRDPFAILQNICLALIAGIALSLITLSVMKAKLKTVRKADSASVYTKENSMDVTESRDLFMYRNVTRIALPKRSGGSRGGGGGRSSGGSISGRF